MITAKELKEQANEFFKKINDKTFIQSVLHNHPTTFTKIVWSKDMAYSLSPLGLELIGFKGSKYLTKKPVTVKFLYEYKLIGDMIREVLIHDEHGKHTDTDYLYRDGESVFELTLDLKNKAYALTELVYKDNRPFSSFRVDKNKDFWYHEYIYVDDKIKRIFSLQSNDRGAGGYLDVDYIDNTVINIYHTYQGNKYNYYKY